jgi:hypothetical protein
MLNLTRNTQMTNEMFEMGSSSLDNIFLIQDDLSEKTFYPNNI